MDALSAETSLSYGGAPPLLTAASSETALPRATEAASASGLQVGAQLTIENARERLRQQASASAIWIEVAMTVRSSNNCSTKSTRQSPAAA